MAIEKKDKIIYGTMSEEALPAIEYYKDPVDINIRIYPDGSRYGIDISAVGLEQRSRIDLSSQDLKSLANELQEQLEFLCSITPDEMQGDNLDKILRPLAEIGNYTFKKIFGHPDAISAIESLLSLNKQGHIQVTSEDFFLPWELLYPGNLEKSVSFDNFLGRNYIISRVIVQRERAGAFVSPEIIVNERPKFGLLTYMDLEDVKKKEVPFFENLNTQGKIILSKLRALDPKKKLTELREFKKFLDNNLNVAHFACHAIYEEKIPNKSHIVCSDEFQIEIQDFNIYNISIEGYPLIFLNACKTGNINSLYTFNFAKAFWAMGARGVVATEWAIEDSFAADFAIRFYTYFLNGMSLGESLLAARRYFLDKNNPGGLLYSLYAHPSIRLDIKGKRKEKNQDGTR